MDMNANLGVNDLLQSVDFWLIVAASNPLTDKQRKLLYEDLLVYKGFFMACQVFSYGGPKNDIVKRP